MKFYNRENEIKSFQKITELSYTVSQLTLVIGRRRIGKTELFKKIYLKEKHLYFFVSRKSEPLLCQEYLEQVKQTLGVEPYGQITSFKNLFGFLMEISSQQHFTLIIDEFQEFYSINPSIYSDMQNIWDNKKNQSTINIILCGSIYSLMKKIFENEKEPLFARQTAKFQIQPFSNSTLKEILGDNNTKYTHEDLLALYLFTGGIAKYIEIFVQNKAFTKDQMLDLIFSENSFFLDEGKNILIEEFGKDYGTYFSILSLIASSKTSRSDIESILGVSVGGYLERLENDFSIIKKIRPINAKQTTKNVRFKIEDNFLSFWFRFIYKYFSAIEIGNYDYVKKIVLRDYETYSGIILEKYFTRELIESKQFNKLGGYWEKTNTNEIDIVGINDIDKRISFFEVKRNQDKISISKLKEKSIKLLEQYPDYKAEYVGLSMNHMLINN